MGARYCQDHKFKWLVLTAQEEHLKMKNAFMERDPNRRVTSDYGRINCDLLIHVLMNEILIPPFLYISIRINYYSILVVFL